GSPLLKQYAVSAPGSAGEKQSLAGLEKLMVEEVPVIPLFFTSGIGFFRTSTVRGFPSQNDPYAVPVPDSVNAAIVLGRVRAGGKCRSRTAGLREVLGTPPGLLRDRGLGRHHRKLRASAPDAGWAAERRPEPLRGTALTRGPGLTERRIRDLAAPE